MMIWEIGYSVQWTVDSEWLAKCSHRKQFISRWKTVTNPILPFPIVYWILSRPPPMKLCTLLNLSFYEMHNTFMAKYTKYICLKHIISTDIGCENQKTAELFMSLVKPLLMPKGMNWREEKNVVFTINNGTRNKTETEQNRKMLTHRTN